VTAEHAIRYLSLVTTRLIRDGSIGVGTLDQIHSSLYCEYYDNDDDSDNYITAHGFSYHNGPEWVWLYGFYIKALLNFTSKPLSRSNAMAMLQNHIKFIKNDLWMGLP
jgi:glycogen debranching enzyme